MRVPQSVCPACDKITTKKTTRVLPDCTKYIAEGSGVWTEVFMADTPDGQRAFHGNEIWVPDKDGKPGEMTRQVNIIEQVPPFTDIHGCDDNGHVRFWVRK